MARTEGRRLRIGLPSLLLCCCVAAPLPAAAQGTAGRGTLGSRAPEFLLEGPTGATTRFPDRRSGEVDLTVVVFWATWNQPSAKELKRLGELWERWAPHHVQIVAVNVENSRIDPADREVIGTWLHDHPLPFPVVLDHGLKAFHAYGVIALPTTLVVDSAGRIVFRLPGYPIAGAEELEKAIEAEVLEEGAQARAPSSSADPGHRRAIRYTHLASQLTQRGQLELAEYTLEKAMEEDPGLADIWLARARLHERSGRLEEARRDLEEASTRFPGDPKVLLARGDLDLRLGNPAEAEALAHTALELDPGLSSALVLIGRARIAGGRPQEARSFFEEAVARNPFDLEACLELAQVAERLGDGSTALDWYGKAYQLLDPTWNP